MQFDYDADIVQALRRKIERYTIGCGDAHSNGSDGSGNIDGERSGNIDGEDSGNNDSGGNKDSDCTSATIGVATSGGVDSQVLLHALCACIGGTNLAVHAIYVNHSVRSRYSTARDVRAIRSITERHNISLHVCNIPHAMVQRHAQRVGHEAACREVRYDMYMKLAGRLRLSWLLLGHHYDDHIESLWLQMLRGRRAQYLKPQPIAEQSVFWHGGRATTIYRPFLEIPKHHLLHYAQRHKVAVHHDSTNYKLTNDRSVLRRVVIKKITRYFPHANHILARHHQYCATVYQQLLVHTIPDNCRWLPYSDDGVYLTLTNFLTLPSVAQCEMLLRGVTMLLQRMAVARHTSVNAVHTPPISSRFLMHVAKQVAHRNYFQIRKSNIVFVLQNNRLYIIYYIDTFASLWYHKLLVVEPTGRSTVLIALSYRGSDIFVKRLCNVAAPCGLSIHRTQDCVKIMIYNRSMQKRYSVPINILGVRSGKYDDERPNHHSVAGDTVTHRIALDAL